MLAVLLAPIGCLFAGLFHSICAKAGFVALHGGRLAYMGNYVKDGFLTSAALGHYLNYSGQVAT
jgi:hypothetical protein